MSLKIKLNLLITLILTFTISALLSSAIYLVEESQKENFVDSMNRTEKVVSTLLDTQRFNLKNQSNLVGVLPILTTVVDNGDPKTIRDTAGEYQKQLNLPIFDVLDSDGELLVSVLDNFGANKENDQIAHLIEKAGEGESTTTLAIRQNRVSLLGSAPVGIPDDPSGVLLIGVFLDDAFAKDVQRLTKADVAFMIDQNITGSSLDEQERRHLSSALQKKDLNVIKNDLWEILDTGSHFLLKEALKDSNGVTIGHMIIQVSLSDLYQILTEIRNLLILVGFSIFVVSIACGIYYASTITNPIRTAVAFASDLAEGRLNENIKQDRDDELGILQKSLESMRLALKDMIDNLDAKIREKTRDISLILEHMPSGLLTFNMEGKVGAEYSAICRKLFDCEPRDTEVNELVFQDEKFQKGLKDWLNLLPHSPMDFEDMVRLAPGESILCFGEGEDRKLTELAFEFIPIYKEGSKDEYEKIMLIAKNVTKEKKLAAQMKTKEEKTEFILKVLKSKDGYVNYLSECHRCILELSELSYSILKDDVPENVIAAFRSAHTIKGNSSAYGVAQIRDAADALESILTQARDGQVPLNDEFALQFQSLIPKLQKAYLKHIQETEEIFGETFDPAKGTGKTYVLSQESIDQLIALVDKLEPSETTKDLRTKVQALELEPISIFLNPYVEQVAVLSEKLDKKIRPLRLIGAETLVRCEKLTPFFGAFVHLIRNCLDHGIEDKAERDNTQKPPSANLVIEVNDDEQYLSIVVSDDGRGIDPQIVGAKAVEKGLVNANQLQEMSEKEIQMLIFSPSFSTKEAVTNVSGRGVGMDAVKHEVEKLGGSIDMDSRVGAGTRFIIRIPSEYKNSRSDDDANTCQRLFKRMEVSEYLSVKYPDQSEAGKLVNISPDGFMLVGQEHRVGESFPLTLSYRAEDFSQDVNVEVEVKRSNSTEDTSESGLFILQFDSENDESGYQKIMSRIGIE